MRGRDSRAGWEANWCVSQWQRAGAHVLLMQRWLWGTGFESAPQDFVAELFPGTGIGEFCKDMSSKSKPLGNRKYGLSLEWFILFYGWGFFPPGDADFAIRMVATWYLHILVWSLLGKKLEEKLGFVGRGPVFFCFAATQLSLSLFNTKICAKAWILSGWGVLGWLLFLIFAKCSLYTASPFECLGLAKGLVQSRAKFVTRAVLPWCPWESWPMDLLYPVENVDLFPPFFFWLTNWEDWKLIPSI